MESHLGVVHHHPMVMTGQTAVICPSS